MNLKRQKSKRPPRAFISYSWDDEANKEWVEKFARRLVNDGVHVTLDQWDAVPGDQLTQFMEKAVVEGDFVLIICTPDYKRKWEVSEGYLVFEKRIILSEILTQQNNRKFIPILRAASWPDAAPASLLASYYIDLFHPESYEANYKKLLQTLHGQRPQRPRMGKPPKPCKSEKSKAATSTLQPVERPASKRPRILPSPRNRLIGRDEDVAIVRDLLGDKHKGLVTLTGPGGTGKTRLALQIAKTIKSKFANGVFYIELSPIKDSLLVVSAIAQALEIKENPGEPLLETIKTELNEKELLLVIDNFEHVVSAAPKVGELIWECQGVKALITSRSPLNISDEHEHEVKPLTVPSYQDLAVTDISQYSAIELFIERAKAVDRTFKATKENLQALAAICVRLDGLPLAIELAAARIRLYNTPQVLLKEMDDSAGRLKFDLFTGGSRDLDPRQQTLEATIAWSYDLLRDDEKALLRQLTVFVGGFTFAAAESVCQSPDVFQQIAALVDLKLLVQQAGLNRAARYVMPETIREYAVRLLAKNSEEKERTESEHARYFRDQVETFGRHLADPEMKSSMTWFRAEQDNLRSALAWALRNNQVEMALGLAYSLSGFWNILGQFDEERSALNRALVNEERSRLNPASLEVSKPPVELLMRVLGRAAGRQLSPKEAEVFAARHMELSRETGNTLEQALALHNLGNIARLQDEVKIGRARLREAIRLFEEKDNKEGMATALLSLCALEIDDNNLSDAEKCARQSLELSEEIENRGHIPLAKTYLAFVLQKIGQRDDEPETLISEGVKMLRDDGREGWLPWALHWKGRIALEQGRPEKAHDDLLESLTTFQRNEDRGGQIRCLLAFAWYYVEKHDYKNATTLLGAEDAQRKRDAAPMPPDWKHEIELIRTEATRNLGDLQFGSIYTEGQRLSLGQAVELVYKVDQVSGMH